MRLPNSNGHHVGQVKQSIVRIFKLNAIVEFLWLNIGTFLIAAGIYFFKFPNHFNTGGVSGVAIVFQQVFPNYSASLFLFIINTLLLILGYIIFGKAFGFKTLYSSVMLSVFIYLLEIFLPLNKNSTLTGEPVLELIFGVLLPGVGAAIIFNIDASNGGSDIIGMILKKYTNLNIGTALGIVDIIFVAMSFPVSGVKINLLNVLGLFIKATVTDMVIESLNLHKYFTIITTQPEKICNFITFNLKKSATVTKAQGAYSKEERSLILTVLRRGQAIKLQKFMHDNDPEAFMLITNTSEIIGKGFRGIS